MENEEQKLPNEVTEEKFTDEGIIEFTSASEYIASAYYALAAVLDMDEMQYGKDSIVQQRIKRIKRKSLKIIDICISEMYDELFENTDEE